MAWLFDSRRILFCYPAGTNQSVEQSKTDCKMHTFSHYHLRHIRNLFLEKFLPRIIHEFYLHRHATDFSKDKTLVWNKLSAVYQRF
jgi:hypothetical protein